jgi:hypothetical protein
VTGKIEGLIENNEKTAEKDENLKEKTKKFSIFADVLLENLGKLFIHRHFRFRFHSHFHHSPRHRLDPSVDFPRPVPVP